MKRLCPLRDLWRCRLNKQSEWRSWTWPSTRFYSSIDVFSLYNIATDQLVTFEEGTIKLWTTFAVGIIEHVYCSGRFSEGIVLIWTKQNRNQIISTSLAGLISPRWRKFDFESVLDKEYMTIIRLINVMYSLSSMDSQYQFKVANQEQSRSWPHPGAVSMKSSERRVLPITMAPISIETERSIESSTVGANRIGIK